MKRLIAALALAAGLVIVPAPAPAAAHNESPTSAYVCAYAREWPYQNHVLLHSYVISMGNGWVKYGCEGTDLDTVCLWTAVQSIFGITGQSQGCSEL